ncbi:hypothetical protein DAEQUDRAFT_762205 [Daedalea quercina L-15889]|uniref:Uncharacterized protein n=1 Tax=Daedalea quercina L-15889 TaxID=1314783 RepID=A0A165TDE4_9APHY|nr:hypothetical protein DAEQUDRAFT_762205 [Daedalea quercina L-15889]
MALLLEDEHWEVPNDDRLLFTAAADYRTEAWNMQLELYRAPSGTEFILTENGLGLREGASTPMNILYNVISPGGAQESWFTFTRSFPITPKLVIMLRDGMPAWEARRRTHASVGLVLTSSFHDIPRTMPRATYIPPFPPGSVDWMEKEPRYRTSEERKKEEDRQLRGLVNGVPLASRLQDRFIFAISDLTEDQAGKVNTLLLTHCKETISFLTPGGLLRAIEAFERDRELTTENKARYKSLKTKLLAERARVSPSPTTSTPPSPSTTVSPTSQPSATASSTSDLRATMEAAPLEASLPGVRGIFKRRPAAVPHKTALARPDVPEEELPLAGIATVFSRSSVDTSHATISHPSAPTSDNDSMAAVLVTPEVEAPLLVVERDLSTIRPSTSDADMPIRVFPINPTIPKPAESSLERAADVPGDKEMETTLCDNQGLIPGGHDSIFVDDAVDTQVDGFRTDVQPPPAQNSQETPWWVWAVGFASLALIGGSYVRANRRG